LPHFVHDQNFPIQVTGLPWPPSVRITSLEAFDRRLNRDHDDWQVLVELHRRGGVDGYISNDAKMLNLPTEMVALASSQLAFVVTDGVGDDPLAATGLLMVYLVQIAKQIADNPRPMVYRLRASDLGRQSDSPRTYLRKIADNQYAQIHQLISRERAKIRAWRLRR
jgi:hypothetical protein